MNNDYSLKTYITYGIFGFCAAFWVYAIGVLMIDGFFLEDDVNRFWWGCLFCGFSYFIGSFPSGIFAASIYNLGSLRGVGSGNIGATNVLRTGHKGAASLTLFGDIFKGVFACLLIYFFPIMSGFYEAEYQVLFGFFALIGHIFPLWLGFCGGKGVATYIGILWGINPLAGAASMVVWAISAYATQISSLSALIMIAVMPFIVYFLSDINFVIFMIMVMSVIVLICHRQNILRLFRSEESKISL